MRIGLNCMLLTGNYSGIHQYIWRLVQALHKLDHDNEYVVYAPRDSELDALTGKRWKVHRTWFRGKRRVWRILWENLRLPSLSFKHQLDVVHCPAYVAPNLLVKPTVVTIHDVITFTHPELCKRSHVIHLKKRLPKTVQNVERMIVPSVATRAALLDTFEECDAEKIRVIPWGVGDEFRPITDRRLLEKFRKQAGLPERFILFVGNREPKKNLEALVKVFYAAVENSKHLAGSGDRSSRGSVIPHQLVIVGARGWGRVDAKLSRLVRELAFEGRVFMTNYLAQELMPLVYNLADAVMMPSLVEGFGLPVLEAMACGTPVMISSDPALTETAGDAAWVVDGEDLRSMREGIETLLQDRALRRRLREAGLKRAKEFSWERTARRTLEVYREAIDVRRQVGTAAGPSTDGDAAHDTP